MEIEITNDGSHTLFVPALNEHYHSTNGAIQEARHVFIDAGLAQINKKEINILEIGFGTGLNAFLTILEARRKKHTIKYTATELYPLPTAVTKQLNFPKLIDLDSAALFDQLHHSSWEKREKITPDFSILKLKIDITTEKIESDIESYDLIYFDAFGPDKQPEMWKESVFRNLYAQCANNGILVTYSAKGSVRRLLQTIGFHVERISGPPGKREMIRAVVTGK